MTPFLLTSHDQFRPAGPPALTFAQYAADLNEVKSLGSATSTTRTPEQTQIALFFGDNLSVQLQAAYCDHITRHHLDVVRAARLLAAADLATADAAIASWDAKLLVTPPFPDYISGHTTVTGAVTQTLTHLSGTPRIDLNMSSAVTGTTRHYEWASQLNAESIGARIWAGIHFRTADETGNAVGKQIGAWAVNHYFTPTEDY